MLRHINLWTLAFKSSFSLQREDITFSVAEALFLISSISLVVVFRQFVSCLFSAVSLVISAFTSSTAGFRSSKLSSLLLTLCCRGLLTWRFPRGRETLRNHRLFENFFPGSFPHFFARKCQSSSVNQF